MDVRREMMGVIAAMASGGNVWNYQLITIIASSYKSFNTYADFANEYVYPYLSGITDCVYDVNIKNNTMNARAAQWHIGVYQNSNEVAQFGGRRQNSNFNGSYGGDIYEGAIIELRICTQIMDEHTN